MSFAVRLAVAFVLVAVLATGLWGYEVRTTTRETMEADLAAHVDAALTEAHEEVAASAKRVSDTTLALCDGPFLDRSVDDALDHGALDEEAAGRGLDQLLLLPHPSSGHGSPELEPAPPTGDPAIRAWCSKSSHGHAIGLAGSVLLRPIIERISRAHGVALTLLDLERPGAPPADGAISKSLKVDEVTGLTLVATAKRDAVAKALGSLDRRILEDGGVMVVVALALAILLARNFAKPIRELAHETREVLTGEPHPVRQRGSKEIRDLADTFNHTIEELQRIKKRLAATERIAARREIARQVAHEIKNPLAPIRAAVETLRRLRGRNDEAFDDYFDEATKTVLEEVHRIANIVSQFTKFSRLPPPNLAPMNIVSVAKRVVALHAADPDAVRTGAAENPAEGGRVDLIAEEVPEIRADRDQMVQVLTNLVANGLDAAAAVRKDPRVNVTISPIGDGKIRIVVRDNGPGVAEEMREKLFEPYATSKKNGTGLGLAICQRIVFEHGGEIIYRPATKGGAVFEIVLPIAGPTLLEKSMEISQNPTSRFES